MFSLLKDTPASATSVLAIDTGAIQKNWRYLSQKVSPAICSAVVKANCYGLGMAALVPALMSSGCHMFFVACVEEAIALRQLAPSAVIISLGGVIPGAEEDLAAHAIIPTLNTLHDIERWGKICRARQKKLPAYVHFDTGLHRLGLDQGEYAALVRQPHMLDGMTVAGMMSHFSCADDRDEASSRHQYNCFRALLDRLPPAPAGIANSAGIFKHKDFHMDFVRPGAALYGLNPTPEKVNPMTPVVQLWARILQVRSVDRGQTVGYGANYVMPYDGHLATLGLGYADGYSRSLSTDGVVYIEGHAAPVVGRVSMDLLTVDVSQIPDIIMEKALWAQVIGPHVPVDDVARRAGTIGYEILTRLGPRPYRMYYSGTPA